MDAVNEQRELYLDAICGCKPPSQADDLARQGFGDYAGGHWYWSRERLERLDEAALRRFYLGLKADTLPT